MDFVGSFGLTSIPIDGCAFGLMHDGQYLKKPWRIVTDHPLLAQNLKPWTCNGQHKHLPVTGGTTAKTAFYNKTMCRVILNSLFPHKLSSHVPALVCTPPSEDSMPSKESKEMHRRFDMPCVSLIRGPIGAIIVHLWGSRRSGRRS